MPLPYMGTVSISDHIFLIHILWGGAISNQNLEKTNVERAFSSHSPPKPISNVYKLLPYRNWVVKPANLINKLTTNPSQTFDLRHVFHSPILRKEVPLRVRKANVKQRMGVTPILL